MKQHLSDYIKDKYPLACRNMRGVEQLGKGWWPLIDYVLSRVEVALTENPEMPFEISQIKEKFGCYDEHTEVLTADGWLFFKDTTTDTEFACLTEDDYLVYHKSTDLIKEKYSGAMYNLKTRGVDLVVTTNHNLWMAKGTTNGGEHNSGKKEYQFQLQTYHALFRKPKRLQKGTQWKGKVYDTYTIPERELIKVDGRVYKYKQIEVPIVPLVRLLGWFVAEGNIDQRSCSTMTLSLNGIDLKEGEYVKSILNQLPFRYKTKWYKDKNLFSIRIYNTQLCTWVDNVCGHGAYNKRIPTFIKELCPALIREFLNELYLGDGHKSKTARVLTTVSRLLADDVMECILKVGDTSSISIRPPSITIKITGKYNVYNINWLTSSYYHHTSNSHDTAESLERKEYITSYDGYVYCATVPGNKLFVRRGGKPVWCGNSLRFYYSGGDDAIDELVSVAENSSSKVCEECGAPGKMRGRSWVYTACDEHTADKDK